MSNKTLKQLTTEFTETAADDLYLMQRDSDSVTGKIKAKNAFGGGWSPIGGTLSVQSGYNKGNREFVIDTTEDLTGLISPGMRFKYTPTTTPPTQCADFESSNSQYATKSSPSGITFTDDFTVEAWIKLESYTGSQQVVVNRRDSSTAGWDMRIGSDGRLIATSLRIASNNRQIASYQSVPIGRWIHVAATMDNSANSHTMYIDGVSVPFETTTTGTITAIVQPSVDLRIGSLSSSAGNYFDGKIADVRVWSAVRTATEIRDNMWSTLTGSETNLVAYFPLNGDFNDSTANNNHLTAAGSPVATATNSDTPMPSTMFGIFTKVTSSELTVFTGSDYGIMNDGFSTSYFSYQKVPFGFPASRNKWMIESLSPSTATPSSATAVPGLDLSYPIGEWSANARVGGQARRTSGTGVNAVIGISSSSTDFSDATAVGMDYGTASAQPYDASLPPLSNIPVSITSQSTRYIVVGGLVTTITLITATVGSPTTSFLHIHRAYLTYL